jgi:hypothetical protein
VSRSANREVRGSVIALFLGKGSGIDEGSFTVSKCSLFELYSWSGQRLPSVTLVFVLLVFDCVIPNVRSAYICVRLNKAVLKVTQHDPFIRRIAFVFANDS